jgi:4-amino-4-deoxy-L-arabinose transferase-like glycosyltransferase
MLRNFIFFLLLAVIAIVPRFIFLNQVPVAINQDEIHYALDAKSFFLTGEDTFRQVTPLDILLFNSPKSESLQAELQYFLEIPVLGLMGFSMANLVLPNALLSILTVAVIYLITRRLFNKNAAILAGLIAAINPWLIFLSRTTYEAGLATLFFLCVFYVLLVAKSWKILLAIPFALLAFYSYIGTKLIFLPFIFLTILYVYWWVNKRQYLKQYLLVFLFSCALMLFFVFQLRLYGVSRTDEILLPNNPAIISQVDGFRKVAIQTPLLDIFDNKFSVYSMVLTKNAFNAFSPSYLFMNADFFFMSGGQGLFYSIDVIFLVIGVFWIFLHNRKMFFVFLSLIFIGVLPQVFHDPLGAGNFTPHIALVVPIFIIMIGVGIDSLLGIFKRKKYLHALITIAVGLLYAVVFINFMYFYLFKFPLQDGTFEIGNRVLAKYIALYDNKTPIKVYSTNGKLAYKEFLFYTNAYNKNNVNQINESLKENKLTFNNVSFLSCDGNLKDSSTSIVIDDAFCSKTLNKKTIKIAEPKDSGARYFIYNDKICSQYNLPGYINNLKLADLDIENLSTQKFCQTYLISN